MNSSKHNFPISSLTREAKPSKSELKKLTAQHETLIMRINGLREALIEKDIQVNSYQNIIKQQEQQLSSLEYNNNQMKNIISILSNYITEELNEPLPPLPSSSNQENSKNTNHSSLAKIRDIGPIRKPKKPTDKRFTNTEIASALNTFATAQKNGTGSKQKTMMFDEDLRVNMYEDFKGSELLKSVLDAQLCREEMKKVIKFLLGKTSKDVFMFKTRTILFETISLFLSLRNVVFQNQVDVFLPRVLEMLVDILEVQRAVLYIYEPKEETFYSKIVTSESPVQIVIDKTMGHFRFVEEALIINKACEDPRFDIKYDRISSFITTNLVCYPLKLHNSFIGFLECSNKAQDFTKEDMILLSQVSKQLAVGISGYTIKSHLKNLSLNARVSGHIQHSKDSLILPILDKILTNCKVLINCERATIFIYDSNTNELVSLIATDLSGTIRIPLHRGLASLAFTTAKVINCDDVTNSPSFHSDVDRRTGFITREILAVKIGDFGVVECINKNTKSAFTKSDEGRLVSISEIIKSVYEAADNFEGLMKNSDVNEMCLQAVKEAILQVNMEGLLMKANKFAAKVFRLTAERMAGASVNEVFEESEELLMRFMQTVRDGVSVSLKDQRLVVDRKTFKVNTTFLLVKNANVGTFYIIIITMA